MANIRDWFHLAIFEKGISHPVNNLTNMIGNPKGRTRVNGHYYDLDDFGERMVCETRMEIEQLKANARRARSFED